MRFNLSHPDNKDANALAQSQRVAALWVNKLRAGKINRKTIERDIESYSTQEQKTMRYWLNVYLNSSRPVVSKPRKVKPDWIR